MHMHQLRAWRAVSFIWKRELRHVLQEQFNHSRVYMQMTAVYAAGFQ